MRKIYLLPVILCAIFTAVLFAQVHAQAGILDNNYGNNGVATTAVGPGNSEGWGMAMQDDWSVVLGGFAYSGVDSQFALIRYNADGLLDSTFGVNGEVITQVGTGSAVCYSVAIQADGKIVAGGMAWVSSKYDFALARYNTNGTLDSTFGTNGIELTSLSSGNDKIRSIAVEQKTLQDWSVVVGGATSNGSYSEFGLARYKSNGTPDSTFGTDGIVKTNVSNGPGIIYSLLVQPDWSVVVGGASMVGTRMNFALARYLDNGNLDNTFGTNGTVLTAIGDSTDVIWSMALQPDNKIIAGGFSTDGGNKKFAVARYDTTGKLDASFGSQGKAVTALGGSYEMIYSIVLQPDQKIVASGTSNALGYNTNNNALARYNSNGALDNSFGNNGIIISNLSSGNNETYAGVMQPDGKVIVSGFASDSTTAYFFAARYLTGLTLGVLNLSASNNTLLIYPNPIEQSATLQYTLAQAEQISIRLLDIQGKVVTTFISNVNQTAGDYKLSLPLPEGLAAGSYLINISSPEGQMSVKIAK